MYKTVLVAKAKSPKFREAIAAFKAVAAHLNSKHGTKAEVYTQLFGQAGTIYVISEWKDLAAFQAAQAIIMADPEVVALVNKVAEVADPPTTTLLQPV